jgi:hypothetical protein
MSAESFWLNLKESTTSGASPAAESQALAIALLDLP